MLRMKTAKNNSFTSYPFLKNKRQAFETMKNYFNEYQNNQMNHNKI
jgi:hypothetical protein